MGENKTLRAAILTLGCRVNQYESDAIAGILEKNGFRIVPFGDPCDAVIVNTCTVTAESDRKSRQHIRRAVQAADGAPVIVTGCFAQIAPEETVKIPGVSAVVGNGEKSRIPSLVQSLILDKAAETLLFVSDISEAEYDPLTLPAPRRARAFIKIEDGCENHCAYCIIPAARGKIRSKKPEDVLTEAKALADVGCQEIILTGIETAAYGRESGGAFSLATLLPSLSAIPGIRRIALGSLDPSLMRNAFLAAIAPLPEILPHFHLSLQSGSSGVLKRMRRPYNAGQAMERIRALRTAFPTAMLTADVIVGFPGETEEEFNETVSFCREARFLHLHIFPYSIRKGTEAAVMPGQIPDTVKKERAAALAAVQREIKANILHEYVKQHEAEPVSLLIEEIKNGMAVGHSEHFCEIRVPKSCGSAGDIVPIRLTDTDGDICFGILYE